MIIIIIYNFVLECVVNSFPAQHAAYRFQLYTSYIGMELIYHKHVHTHFQCSVKLEPLVTVSFLVIYMIVYFVHALIF